MENRTENIEKALQYVSNFFNELSRMLRDIVELMSDEGWTVCNGRITDGLSYNLDNPGNWMYNYIYLDFVNPKISDHVKQILVFLNASYYSFPVSIVCGKLRGNPSSLGGKGDIYWIVLEHKERLHDLCGDVISLELNSKKLKGDLFAVSLADIGSPKDLKDKIVRKLINL